MIKRIDRYIFVQFFGPLMVSVAAFTIIAILDYLFVLADLLVTAKANMWVATQLLIYKIPALMVLFFHISVLFSTMLVSIRMAKDNELVAFQTSGIPRYRVIVPIIVGSAMVVGLSLMVNEYVVPKTNQMSDRLFRQEMANLPPPDISENIFFSTGPHRHIYLGEVHNQQGNMSTISIYDIRSRFPEIITAKSGQWGPSSWLLLDGSVYKFDTSGQLTHSTRFDTMTFQIKKSLSGLLSTYKTPQQMSARELSAHINELKKSGLSTTTLSVEYHLKHSLPAASLVFGLVGVIICQCLIRSSRDWWGVVIGVCIAILAVGFYFFLIAFCRSFGRAGLIGPITAAWAPNIIFFTLSGVVSIYRFVVK